MKIEDFQVGMQFTKVEIDTLISSSGVSDKLRIRLADMKNKWTVDHEVLYYISEQEAWDAGMGSEGYILVRNNEIVDSLVLRMN